MSTAIKHMKRSRRNYRFYFSSKDKAYHGAFPNFIFKDSKNRKKYHGDGSLIETEE